MDPEKFSAAALKLITDAEGLDQPGAWPKGASGITIGHGDDLGYQSAAEFAQNWAPVLDQAVYVRLLDAIGFKGEAAHTLAHQFADIHITQDQADTVFLSKTLPRYIETTRQAFPGFDRLPLDARGALVSLVYNRGAAMGVQGEPSWDQRREMRAIRDEVAKQFPDLNYIARQFQLMKRLWVGKGLDGLLARRDAEAKLIANAKD